MNLFGAVTGESIVNNVRDFFELVFKEFSLLWYWPIIIVGFMLLAIIVMFFLIAGSYENRILKSVNKINTYFLSKPFITEENLVEFNLKMKKVPKVLRNNWQIYMLNREDSPTTYINVNTCIDKPLRTSSIEKNMSNFTIFTILLTFISFVAGIEYTVTSTAVTGLASILFYSTLVPLGIVFLYSIFILIMKLMRNDIYSMLYDNFPLYERNLTKAVSTLPSYVDYEVLFTKKEIKEGIPILQQYLEKRALVEQQELEKARESSAACEEYNFDELGIDGSLVLERAMKECETFIKTRRRLQEECDEIETEKENYKKNFEATEKDFQRKLQASRENLESLKAQQEASTNRIESNYIKKQQGDEIKKQQQLEKDSEEATAKFNEEQLTLEQEVEKRKQEIEEKKSFVEQAMLLEFKHYANTLYKALSIKACEVGNQRVISLAQENADLKAVLNDIQGLQVEAPTVQENLVQPEEVENGSLYEMSNSVQQQLENSREETVENAKIEDQKAEKKAEKQEETNAKSEAKTEENDGDDSTSNYGGNEDGTSTDSNDDGGQQPVDETPIEQQNEDVEEDIDALQKKIEEENANLQKQKEELAQDLNKTISKMEETPAQEETAQEEKLEDMAQEEPKQEEVDEPASEEKPEEQPIEAPAEEVEEVKAEETPVEQPVEASKEEPIKEEETVETPAEEPAKRRAVSRRGAGRATGRSTGRTKSADSASKANSAIDALNAEMEKLLDSAKK